MFALVRLSDHSLVDVPFEPVKGARQAGFEWWPVAPNAPSYNAKTEVAIPMDLYADAATKVVRRLYVVREKTPYELAEDRGLQVLKMLTLSDQPMVRANEDAILLIMEKLKIPLDALPPEAAALFKKRKDWRDQLR